MRTRPLPIALLLVLGTSGAPACGQTFSDVASSLGFPSSGDSTRGMGWADYDGDGDFDVYLQNSGSTSRLLRNDGASFTDVTAAMGVAHSTSGWSVGWGDDDNDGKVDLYLGNFAGNNHFRNRFPQPFADVAASTGTADASFAQGVSWIDHDQDGDLDLYITKEIDPHRFLTQRAPGVFVDDSVLLGLRDPQSAGYGLSWGDYDQDGDLDCFVSTCGAGTINRLFRSNRMQGTLGYTEIAALAGVNYQPNTYGCHFADFDNDGDLDLFVAGARGERNLLYRNDLALPFAEVATAAGIAGPLADGHGVAMGDYDNDGWLDLYIQDFQGTNRLYRNLGTGSLQFQQVANAAGANASGQQGYDCVFVDFDNDGDLDIHSASTVRDRLYRNSGNANHWLQVFAVGTIDNRSAIAATVEIEIQGRRQSWLLNASAGAFNQNHLPAHFGLGSATVVDRVTVRWLDGTQDTWTNVAADQRLRLVQRSGLASATIVGAGCPGTGGLVPSLSSLQPPLLGAPLVIALAQAAPNTPAFFLAALNPVPVPLPLGNGCTLELDLATSFALLQTSTNLVGNALLPVAIPSSREFLGAEILLQGVVLDPQGAPLPGGGPRLTLSNALALRLGVAAR
ncbi:MAG: CRTAC1 family protein [Planctomycetes bacterium]|nr:CRTAC1 family protein [Planctomycetota bacterium]